MNDNPEIDSDNTLGMDSIEKELLNIMGAPETATSRREPNANVITELAPAAAEAEPLPLQDQLIGAIDVVTSTEIQGWVRSPTEPQLRLELLLSKDSTPLKSAVADEFRETLREEGQGDGKYGFTFDLSASPLQAGEHSLSIVSAYTGRHIPGSPFIVEILSPASAEATGAPAAPVAPAPRAAPSVRGHVDGATDTEVSGWAFDLSDPSRRCSVRLVEGDRTLARSRASIYRQDLQEAGIGDGSHAFSLPMPRSLLDGHVHYLHVVDEQSGAVLNERPLKWSSTMGTSTVGLFSDGPPSESRGGASARALPSRGDAPGGRPVKASGASQKVTILVDLSDLVYYIGHHDNLTGIQRVQSSIVLAMVKGDALDNVSIAFISYYNPGRRFVVVPFSYMINLLSDLFYPKELRRIKFNPMDARNGLLPGSVELDKSGALNAATPSVLCLLGAAWVQRDYFHRVLALKRRFNTKFVMLVHDLIPIYARETCDQGTALVFESFFSRAMRHVDNYLCVSENTARDLRAYLTRSRAQIPGVTVTRLGASFGEFLAEADAQRTDESFVAPDRFVLFVSTIEGRKNHQFIFDIWRTLVERGEDPPTLLCVGRVGWKAESFISNLVETGYLGGRIVLLEDISDAQLQTLYKNCLFTVFPSLYEGWGLPVGESLANGKICVCSDRASLPEVAGEFGVTIDIGDLEKSVEVVKTLIDDDDLRARLEDNIVRNYKPTSWEAVARTVVRTCENASRIMWPEPYPYAELPFSSEIGFSSVPRTIDGTFGGDLMARTLNARKSYFQFEALSEQSILLAEDARSGGAWAEPEPWGCWLCEGGGDIVATIPNDRSRYYYLFLRIRASGMMVQSKTKLSLNGDLIWENIIGDQPRNLALRIVKKTGATPSGWRIRLRAEIDLSEELRSRMAAVDSRIPTIGFERLMIIPESDTRARLDALTRVLMDRA